MINWGSILIAVAVLAVIGAVLGVLIGIFSKFFHVQEDTRIEKIIQFLPGANCGACGHPGCSGMAQAIVEEGEDPRQCKPNKQENVDQIKLILDEFNKIKVENTVSK